MNRFWVGCIVISGFFMAFILSANTAGAAEKGQDNGRMTLRASKAQLAAFVKDASLDDTSIIMLNLLKYREQAKYPEGFNAEPCSGKQAYERYAQGARETLKAIGARAVWKGKVEGILIGPEGEYWDDVILVQYPSRKIFLKMVKSDDYKKASVHRTAALEDSRLICTDELMNFVSKKSQ
ncbi:MAG: DUF1330 domain-containing protein [Deltaproteobacteria bacterium]|nr:DUF1330 domain-containing protein [Deltaproteobacteria bacterium]